MDISSILIGFAIVIVALTIHEAAHAWTADRLGDPTARLLGRVSLNPLVHIDPIGTILLPLLAMFSGLPMLGWAKPVPVNISRLRHHRRDFMIVAAAGPISNLLQAFVLPGCSARSTTRSASDLLPAILKDAVTTNLSLAFFNLIPIPPLDGGNVLAGLVRRAPRGCSIRSGSSDSLRSTRLMLSGHPQRADHAAHGVLL